jgi:hypothetical protein
MEAGFSMLLKRYLVCSESGRGEQPLALTCSAQDFATTRRFLI